MSSLPPLLSLSFPLSSLYVHVCLSLSLSLSLSFFLSLPPLLLPLPAVDPGRVWKGPWRWYHENMLDCCVPLSKIETQGITLEQFNCLAACNGLNVQTVRPDPFSPTLKNDDLEKFRDLVRKVRRPNLGCFFVVLLTQRRVGWGKVGLMG